MKSISWGRSKDLLAYPMMPFDELGGLCVAERFERFVEQGLDDVWIVFQVRKLDGYALHHPSREVVFLQRVSCLKRKLK